MICDIFDVGKHAKIFIRRLIDFRFSILNLPKSHALKSPLLYWGRKSHKKSDFGFYINIGENDFLGGAMAATISVFKRLGKTLESGIFNNKGLIGRFVGGQTKGIAPVVGQDTITFLKNKSKAPYSTDLIERTCQRVLKLLPKSIQPTLGGALKGFNELPGVRGLSSWVKSSLLIEGMINVYDGVKDGIEGFQKTQGNLISKTIGGIKSSAKSLLKSAGVFAASTWVCLAVPALLGVEVLGATGIITGSIASMFAVGPIRNVLDKLFDTHGHTGQTENHNNSPSNEPLLDNPEDNNVLTTVDRYLASNDFSTSMSHLGEKNPWLNPDMNLAHMDKLLQ